ncbi:sodium/potassium-transporting ATPase subunit beta-1-interacting protein 3-like isoform X1 [Haliotis rubra]|uniref:sodium/potassium-transporting ATPase subunit beta-1-interacting protein 3-like isoform X1 n=1 Tax=Haliotis rubra TaxID=36100 RepID=UPI001EE574D9|nr:sodium/potassium-transporting ATPase subunit beta-1-interacting protein 3-like isoform X1 [Haliotis rubra]XP_046546315.1 sodium/potassium-transporting ATPase subunit beta-1-interacting protein 3-like isoform X1 [Haliotis rubra]
MGTSEKCFTRAVHTTLVVMFSVQLVSTVERQVFDFLGFMWAPIIGNFFQLFCVIIGLFGTCQYRPRFIIVYTVWSLLWLGWNLFVICIYLEVGVLRRDKELYILTIGTKNKSWWLEHGVGCTVTNTSWMSSVPPEASRPIPPEEFVDGCILQYYYVEVIHAAVQCLLSLLGFVVSCVTIYAYTEEEESYDQYIRYTQASPANDELEFVKMRYRSPAHNAYRDNQTFDHVNMAEFTTLEMPPSYDTTMRDNSIADTTAANLYYASDRQSVRSKASTRSKRSNRNGNTTINNNYERREELPWVQITPSAHGDNTHHRNYP